ncbi:alpha/beta fold hydrolase [Micromonospora globispora]|uniref:alpha/beta fold hydrolase n=1 Tax=Micromonospora globispora TaxID=1450148 RepID=UPI000F5EEE04|nr:alpha/beta hydrolase [Micromonospora globispora]RQW85072.1 alpha/beta hydrolase [Micromonospora globispora]
MRVEGHDGTGLNVIDFGGEGPGILLLHGLTGRAANWTATARWLTRHGRVVGYDARGHGHSDKPDGPYDRPAYVGDAAAVIEALDLAPAVVIGHSMGGLTAWQLAGARPDLVAGVVIADMNPVTPPNLLDRWAAWLADWPVPFPTLADVRDYFGAERRTEGDSFVEVMTGGPDGWRPLARTDHVLASLAHWSGRDHRPELAAVTCPALVVAGAQSDQPVDRQREMAELLPDGRWAVLPDAGHVLYYDNPDGWRAAVEPFVAELTARAAHAVRAAG